MGGNGIPAVAALSGLVVLVAAAGLVAVSWQWQKAIANAAEARLAQDDASRLAAEKSGLAEKNQRLADDERRQRIESQQRLVNLYQERGMALCAEGKVSHGLLWLAEALKGVQNDPSAAAQQRIIRLSIGGWLSQMHNLLGSVNHQGRVHAVAFSPDGRGAGQP